MPQEDVEERAVRDEEPAPVNGRQAVLERAHVALAAERALEPGGRAGAQAEHPITADRIAHLEPPEQGVGIVVGHVEVREVHPHL